MGQSLLLCASTGVLLEFHLSHCSTPLQVEVLLSGVSTHQVWGLLKPGACCLLGGLPHQCVAGLICSSSALSLLFFPSKNVFTSEALNLLNQGRHNAKTPPK